MKFKLCRIICSSAVRVGLEWTLQFWFQKNISSTRSSCILLLGNVNLTLDVSKLDVLKKEWKKTKEKTTNNIVVVIVVPILNAGQPPAILRDKNCSNGSCKVKVFKFHI